MASPLLVWGAGGHGRVVADVARVLGCDVLGFIDRNPAAKSVQADTSEGRVIVPEADFLEAATTVDPRFAGVRVALGIGNNALRLGCLAKLAVTPQSLVHPTAVVSPSVRLGPGTVIFAMAVVNTDAVIGAAVIVNSGAIVEHDCRLDDAVHVSPGAILTGGVTVGREGWIGAGATVLPGVKIGAYSVVGAGSVVTRDVPDSTTVVGVPARPMNYSD